MTRVLTVIAGAVLLGSLLAGCRTPAEVQRDADAEAYATIAAKQQAVPGAERPFTIDTPATAADIDAVEAGAVVDGRLGEGARIVSLADAMAIAMANSRDFQQRKEQLYLTALTLSDQKHRFETIFNTDAETELARQSDGDITQGETFTAGFSRLLKSGATVSGGVALNILEYYVGAPARTARTVFNVNLSQPLLRGYGADIVAEGLTQADRNVIYEVRDFTRYRRTFAVAVASNFYRLAEQQDAVINEYRNFQNLVAARERAEALSVDRLPEFQVDQAKQDELNARNSYILAVDRYRSSLDDFKLTLCLPLSTRLRLDASILKDLAAGGLPALTVSREQALELAIASRLDLLSTIDRLDDSRRQVRIAADALRGDLTFTADFGLASRGSRRWESFEPLNYTSALGLAYEPGLDRLSQRNDYRRELIDFERSRRSLELAVDRIQNDVRRGFRNIDQARQRYVIQVNAVELARRRVESANLLLLAGKATVRDMLEAQAALVRAQNAVTQALVDYHLARLELLRDIGRLEWQDGHFASDLPPPAAGETPADDGGLITPEELFGGTQTGRNE